MANETLPVRYEQFLRLLVRQWDENDDRKGLLGIINRKDAHSGPFVRPLAWIRDPPAIPAHVYRQTLEQLGNEAKQEGIGYEPFQVIMEMVKTECRLRKAD